MGLTLGVLEEQRSKQVSTQSARQEGVILSHNADGADESVQATLDGMLFGVDGDEDEEEDAEAMDEDDMVTLTAPTHTKAKHIPAPMLPSDAVAQLRQLGFEAVGDVSKWATMTDEDVNDTENDKPLISIVDE